jgi:hypothetical protein
VCFEKQRGAAREAVDRAVADRNSAVMFRMKYADGQEVGLGDRVKLGQDEGGIVVASIDTHEYSEDYSEAERGYLKKGVVINFPQHGLIHHERPDPDLQLIGRAQQHGSC